MPTTKTRKRQVSAEQAEPVSPSAKVLGQNLTALMAHRSHKELSSNPKLGKKTNLGSGTIHRLRNGQVNATLGTLEKLAEAFEVQAWQLLVPGFDVENPPMLRFASDREVELHKRFKELAREFIKE